MFTEAVDGNIARMLRKRSNASEVAVAVLTHGTNVMEERVTVGVSIDSPRPVVMTAAMRDTAAGHDEPI